MDRIETVSPEVRFLISKVQRTLELNDFVLTGGTNLALRFDHRVSVDIDLFTNKKLGIEKSKIIIDHLYNSFHKYNPKLVLMNDHSNSKAWIRMMVEMNNQPDLISSRTFLLCILQNKLMVLKWHTF